MKNSSRTVPRKWHVATAAGPAPLRSDRLGSLLMFASGVGGFVPAAVYIGVLSARARRGPAGEGAHCGIIRAKSPGYPINVAYSPAGRRLANDVARGARFAIDSAGAAYRLAAGELAGMRDAMLAATAGSARISQLQQLGERTLLAWFKVASSLLAAFGTDLVNLPMIRTANGRSGDAIMFASS